MSTPLIEGGERPSRAARALLPGLGVSSRMPDPDPDPPAQGAPLELEARILALLGDGTPRTSADVAAALGAAPEGVGLALTRLGKQRRLVRAGRVRQEHKGWGGARWAALWTVPPAPPSDPTR